MNAWIVLPLIPCFLNLLLILIVLRSNWRGPLHRILSLFLLALAVWAFAVYSLRISPTLEGALIWQRVGLAVGPIGALFYYHFTVLLNRAATSTVSKRLLISGYFLVVLFLFLVPTDLLMEGNQLKFYGPAPVLGKAFSLYVALLYFFVSLGIVNLWRAARRSPSHQERNRAAYVILGTVCFLCGGLSDVLPVIGVHTYPMGMVGNLLFCLFTTIAIVRHQLLDIQILVRKGIAYLLASTLVAIPYVGIIVLFNNLFGTNNVPVLGYFILLILLALVLQPLWQMVQRVVDRAFYRERYDFLKELEYFSQESHDISNLEELGSSLVKLISRALQTSNVHLLLRSEFGDFSVISSAGDSAAELTLKDDSPLLRWMQTNKGLLLQQNLDTIPQLQSLSAKERSDLKDIEAELFVPLRTNKDELVGLLVLGKKLSQQFYSEEDMRLISTVASRVAIELENARLYTMETMMRQELERQDEQKTEFLHNVAHELKTPLTAIISSSELMSTDGSSATPSVRERLINNINRSAWLMDRRVGELLDLAKIQIGDLQLKLEPLAISVPIDEVASQLSSLFKNKGQLLALEIPDSLPRVKADKERVQQVLLNLLSNANKFSPAGSNIALRARQVNRVILVEVEDSATAIAEEDRDKLFDPYYRGGDDNERQRVPGLGLGLAISRRIVELHQGNIWVKSAPGKGNTFIFSLPTWNGGQTESDNSPTLPK